jgi:hypothetical protein
MSFSPTSAPERAFMRVSPLSVLAYYYYINISNIVKVIYEKHAVHTDTRKQRNDGTKNVGSFTFLRYIFSEVEDYLVAQRKPAPILAAPSLS